tara:strand:- start:366 stop:644 length:279 start_codon:yes stop_codon:yes gene_type:complete
MKITDWEFIERQHNAVQRLVQEENWTGIVSLFMEAGKSVGWFKGKKSFKHVDPDIRCNLLGFWMTSVSVPIERFETIFRVFGEVTEAAEDGS